ncbi:ribosomal protein S5 domain 2-type protein [Gaertneriomyces semiglobifer]|nr:ribosomal protein S5 domain 2-type protein [Gaertneriomyces semiglobifer]
MPINQDLSDEFEALHAIYDASCLHPTSDPNIYILQAPTSVISPQITLRIHIPNNYPASRPEILDNGTGVALARETLEAVWTDGQVCMYDLIEGLREMLAVEDDEGSVMHDESATISSSTEDISLTSKSNEDEPIPDPNHDEHEQSSEEPINDDQPATPWTVAPAITERKSVFIGRALSVNSPAEATQAIQSLIRSDKRIQRATHNITAYRIVRENASVLQDNDDDGETAAGSRLAHLMQIMDVRNVVVVVSRWYGGVKLGPDRFRLINNAARDALVLGGWVKNKDVDEERSKHKSKKKNKR